MIHIEVNRVHGDYGFEAKDSSGHIARMDTSPETGGDNFGIRPMQMLLMGLGGCSGIDIISILKKQRQTVKGFRMLIDGERDKGKEQVQTLLKTYEDKVTELADKKSKEVMEQ